MLRVMVEEWSYPAKTLLKFAVRLVYCLYLSGKIQRRRQPRPGRANATVRVLEFLVRQKRKETGIVAKAKPQAEIEDLDLSEIEDMDLGELNVELDEDDLEEAVEKLAKDSKKSTNGKPGVSDEAVLTLTKEVRDNNTFLRKKVEELTKVVDQQTKHITEVLGKIEVVREYSAFCAKMLKAGAAPDPKQAEKDAAVVNKVAADRKAGAKTKAAPEPEEETAVELPKAVKAKVLAAYPKHYKSFTSAPKFAAAISKALKLDEDGEEGIINCLREAGLLGRGGKLKDPE